jgi:hypothetical protein
MQAADATKSMLADNQRPMISRLMYERSLLYAPIHL